jgi:hypothetical protein
MSVDIDGTRLTKEEAAYQRSVMASARAQFAADKPYLRMAREAGRVIATQVECEEFKAEEAREVA